MTISKNVIMVLDTETCDLSGSVYDVGYTITNKKGDILATRNFFGARNFHRCLSV